MKARVGKPLIHTWDNTAASKERFCGNNIKLYEKENFTVYLFD